MTRFRIPTMIAAVAVTATAVFAAAPAANALSNWTSLEDASSTVSNTVTAYPTIKVEVNRYPSYAVPTAPVYKYEAKVKGLDAVDDTCTVYLNGREIDDDPCDWGFSGFEVDLLESGDYAVKTATETLASWTFTKPADTPPPAAPAKCVIKTATAKANAKGIANKIVITTNGKCSAKTGAWNYTFAMEKDGGVSVGFGSLTPSKKNPNVLLKSDFGGTTTGLELTKGSDVTIQYAPNGLIMNTDKNLIVK